MGEIAISAEKDIAKPRDKTGRRKTRENGSSIASYFVR